MTDPALLERALQSAADAYAAVLRDTRPEHEWTVTVRPVPPATPPNAAEAQPPGNPQ